MRIRQVVLYYIKELGGGPRQLPCGTPKRRSKLSDVAPSNKTRWLRPDKYDENHPKAFPPISKSVVKRFSKIAWSTVSNSNSYSNSIDKAVVFNNYFLSSFNTNNMLCDFPSTPFTDDVISCLQLSNEDLLSALKSLNPSKSPGPDEIHPLLLREYAQDLSTFLCTLFNLSLRQGKYPSE